MTPGPGIQVLASGRRDGSKLWLLDRCRSGASLGLGTRALHGQIAHGPFGSGPGGMKLYTPVPGMSTPVQGNTDVGVLETAVRLPTVTAVSGLLPLRYSTL